MIYLVINHVICNILRKYYLFIVDINYVVNVFNTVFKFRLVKDLNSVFI